MTANKKKLSRGLVIIYVVVLLLLFTGLVALLSVINEKQYTMSVTYADGSAFCKSNSVYFSPGQEAIFAVEYFAKNGDPIKEDFSVKIVPANVDDAEVTYRLGESIKTLSFSEIENFNAYFSLEKNEHGFSIVAPEGFSVENAIKCSNPEKVVTLLSEVNLSALHFKAVITSFDGKNVAEIYFDQFFGVESVVTDSKLNFGGMQS